MPEHWVLGIGYWRGGGGVDLEGRMTYKGVVDRRDATGFVFNLA